MKKAISFFLILIVFGLISCQSFKKIFNKNTAYHIPTVNNNVCKKLRDKTVFYAVFVDSKYTQDWTTYDINSTLDSIHRAMEWIKKRAAEAGVPLDIVVDYHKEKSTIVPIDGRFTRKTLSGTLFGINGHNMVDRWADKIAKTALQTYGRDTSTITRNKIKPKDREKLLARLRDIHQTDNVALVYFINNFHTDEISVAMHTASDYNPEYAIVSFKHSSVIAHEFLHLFGAADLYINPFDKKRRNAKRKALAMKEFPHEIMAFPYRRIERLEISPLTEYLIGWTNTLDPKYQELFLGKKNQSSLLLTMKTLLKTIIYLLFPLYSSATAQVGDVLIYNGDTLALFSNPLEMYFDAKGIRSINNTPLNEKSTGCYRGYKAIWEIRHDSLFLISVQKNCFVNDKLYFNLNSEFGTDKVFAHWFSGTTTSPKGEQLQYAHNGYSSLYERELELTLEKGMLTHQLKIDHSKSFKGLCYLHFEKMLQLIYRSIDWSIVPDLGDQTETIYISIESSENGLKANLKRGIPSHTLLNDAFLNAVNVLLQSEEHSSDRYSKILLITLPIRINNQLKAQYGD